VKDTRRSELELTIVAYRLTVTYNRITDTSTFPEYSPPPACDNAGTTSWLRWQSCGWGHVDVGWCVWGRETGGILDWLSGGQGDASDTDSQPI
jgi:hypothetical protein